MKDWDARLYREHTGFVSDLGLPLVRLLNPCPGEKILDVGCGDGALTVKLVELGCEVVAIDSSPEMVEAARARGIDARVLDATKLENTDEFRNRFDAVFSNAALHWMRPIEAVVRGVFRSLKSGGRFVAEFGGSGNVQKIREALHGSLKERGIDPETVDPWCFPSPEEYSALLIKNGFEVKLIDHFNRPTDLPGSITEWIESVARPFLKAFTDSERKTFLKEAERKLEGTLRSDDSVWRADYVRLRVWACRPAN